MLQLTVGGSFRSSSKLWRPAGSQHEYASLSWCSPFSEPVRLQFVMETPLSGSYGTFVKHDWFGRQDWHFFPLCGLYWFCLCLLSYAMWEAELRCKKKVDIAVFAEGDHWQGADKPSAASIKPLNHTRLNRAQDNEPIGTDWASPNWKQQFWQYLQCDSEPLLSSRLGTQRGHGGLCLRDCRHCVADGANHCWELDCHLCVSLCPFAASLHHQLLHTDHGLRWLAGGTELPGAHTLLAALPSWCPRTPHVSGV